MNLSKMQGRGSCALGRPYKVKYVAVWLFFSNGQLAKLFNFLTIQDSDGYVFLSVTSGS